MERPGFEESVVAVSVTSPRETIGGEVSISGHGLFTGVETTLVFKPAPAAHGVVFARTDLSRPMWISGSNDPLGRPCGGTVHPRGRRLGHGRTVRRGRQPGHAGRRHAPGNQGR